MGNNRKTRIIAHGLGIFTAVLWGTTFISTKVLLEGFSPISVLIYRFIIGYAALTLFHPKPLPFAGWKREIWYALAGLSGVTLYFLCENVALTYTLASNVGIIVSLAPMFTAILVFLFLKNEKPGKLFFLGFSAAIAGIVLINYNGRITLALNPKGDLLALGAAVVWAVYSIILKKYLPMEGNIIAATRRIIFYGLLTMVPAAFAMGFRVELPDSGISTYIFNFLYLGIGATAICYVTWNWTIEKLGALKASVYIYIVPVITIAASFLILNEPVTWITVIGALLTLVGLLLSQVK